MSYWFPNFQPGCFPAESIMFPVLTTVPSTIILFLYTTYKQLNRNLDQRPGLHPLQACCRIVNGIPPCSGVLLRMVKQEMKRCSRIKRESQHHSGSSLNLTWFSRPLPQGRSPGLKHHGASGSPAGLANTEHRALPKCLQVQGGA